MTTSQNNASFFWRAAAVVLAIILLGQLFRGVGLAWFSVSALLAGVILNFGLRGFRSFQVFANIVLVLVIVTSGAVTGVFRQFFPHTSKAMEGFPEQADTKMAKGMFDPGQHLQSLVLGFGMFADSLERAKVDTAFVALKLKVAREGLTADNKRIYDSLVDHMEKTTESVKKIVAGQRLLDRPKELTSPPPVAATNAPAVIKNSVAEVQSPTDSSVKLAPQKRYQNITNEADITASSEHSIQYRASNAVDDIIGRALSGEWASKGQLNGAWLKLTWQSNIEVNRIVLYDRPNLTDVINQASLQFSDGTTLKTGPLPNDGAARELNFEPKTINWIRFEVQSGTGENVGLSEIQVYGTHEISPQIAPAP